jgi:hypothetical protein
MKNKVWAGLLAAVLFGFFSVSAAANDLEKGSLDAGLIDAENSEGLGYEDLRLDGVKTVHRAITNEEGAVVQRDETVTYGDGTAVRILTRKKTDSQTVTETEAGADTPVMATMSTVVVKTVKSES